MINAYPWPRIWFGSSERPRLPSVMESPWKRMRLPELKAEIGSSAPSGERLAKSMARVATYDVIKRIDALKLSACGNDRCNEVVEPREIPRS